MSEASRAGVPLQVNRVGSLVTPFFSDTQVRDYTSARRADTARYGRFFQGMLARGIHPPASQFEAWFLSDAHTDRDIASTIKAARGAFEDITPGSDQ